MLSIAPLIFIQFYWQIRSCNPASHAGTNRYAAAKTTTLRNRVKKITGLTVKEYFKRYRLEKAKLLIEQDYGTLGEVAIATGFSSLSYFSKSYKAYFRHNHKV